MLSSETSQARCSKAPQSQEPIRFTVHFLNIFGTTNLTRRIPSPPLSLLCGGINLAARSVAHCARTSSLGSSIIRERDRKSTRLNSSHSQISYAVFCLKKKKKHTIVILLLMTEISYPN